MNVRIFILILTASMLTGCGSMFSFDKPKPVEIVDKPIERTPLNLDDPRPLDLSDNSVAWKIIIDQEDAIYYGVTPEDYQDFSIMFLKIRNYIEQQRQITEQYRLYYEKPVD